LGKTTFAKAKVNRQRAIRMSPYGWLVNLAMPSGLVERIGGFKKEQRQRQMQVLRLARATPVSTPVLRSLGMTALAEV
jgi:hypothetical protein